MFKYDLIKVKNYGELQYLCTKDIKTIKIYSLRYKEQKSCRQSEILPTRYANYVAFLKYSPRFKPEY